nr:probable glutamate receptor [Parasteatoda tepidariorum]
MKNGSWTGIVGMVQRGEADIAVNQLSITKERLKAVNFSIPYSDELIQFVAPTPKRISSLIVYLYPFDIMIWLSCISILLLMPFMHVLLLPKGKKYSTELLRLLGCILKQPMYTKNKRMHRFYILLCLIFSMVISLSYCAVLLSFLSVPLYEPKIRTFSDLSKAVLGGQVKCQVIAGSFVLSLFLNSTDEQLRSVGELVERNSWTFQVKDYKNKTIDDRTASVSSALSLQSLYRDYKNIVFSEDSLMTTNLGIAMSKGFCCKEKLNDMISRIKNAGLYEKIKSEEYLTKPLALSVSHKLTGKRNASVMDADFGGRMKTGRSTSGGGPISLLSQRPVTVAISTTEAETVAAN